MSLTLFWLERKIWLIFLVMAVGLEMAGVWLGDRLIKYMGWRAKRKGVTMKGIWNPPWHSVVRLPWAIVVFIWVCLTFPWEYVRLLNKIQHATSGEAYRLNRFQF